MATRRGQGRAVVAAAWQWLRGELEADYQEWRADQPVRRTIVGVLEMVFAVGMIIRAGMHVGGVMIAYPERFGEVEPEVEMVLGVSHTVVRDLSLGVDLSTRLTAAVYAGWWVQHPPPVIPLPPVADALVTAYWVLNMGFVVLDPVWLGFDRLM